MYWEKRKRGVESLKVIEMKYKAKELIDDYSNVVIVIVIDNSSDR